MMTADSGHRDQSTTCHPTWVFDIPFAPLTLDQATDVVERLIFQKIPSYVITANLNYAMLVAGHPDLSVINRRVALIVPDGITLVWTSRLTNRPLPERVTGTDLLYRFSERAAKKGYSLFFLSAPPGVAQEAARRLAALYPGLRTVGTEAPLLDDLKPDEHERLIARIRTARPDVLFAALGQPKGERWIAQNYRALGASVCIQVGSAIDFAAGRIPRAPHWMRDLGLETPYRIYQEPIRLIPRYSRNLWFLTKSLIRFALNPSFRRQDRSDDRLVDYADARGLR
jgi:N-acetylglucosaminyldiphosphoundecaprenol N-acetyl-beta-D-mannosaminyltransferase